MRVNAAMTDGPCVVFTAPLLDDFVSVGEWTEVSRVRSEPEAVKLAATLRSNDAVVRVLRSDDLAVLLAPPLDNPEGFDLRIGAA